MIKVERPAEVPRVLRTDGVRARRKLCRAFARAEAMYTSGQRRLEIDRTIYGNDEVKAALRDAQHEKCAFCESRVTHVSYGDVEHFRPKGGFRQSASDPMTLPGYYWLAYEWTNLLFACQVCNQRHKKNDFPLMDPAKRARCHRDSESDETPMFVDPSAEDPARSISFRAEVAHPKNRRGKVTLQALGLNREPLQQKRREMLEMLRLNFVLAFALPASDAARLQHEIADARAILRCAVEDGGEYAAMVRAAIPRWKRKYGIR